MSGILLVAALVAGALAFNFFVRAQPAVIAGAIRRLGAYAVLGLGGVLLLRGQFFLSIMLLLAGVYLMVKSGDLKGLSGSADKPAGQKSRVKTRNLAMELDHDTGEMDGDVLSGEHAGQKLSELDFHQLLNVYYECVADGPQSASLMEAYLDRHQPEWRETEDVSPRSEEQARAAGSVMTRGEALDILGLAGSASEDEIRAAHRALMKQFHPDHGGSSYLASKINQAKDLLLQ